MTRNFGLNVSRSGENGGTSLAGAPTPHDGASCESNSSIYELAACVFVLAIAAAVALFVTLLVHVPFMDLLDLN